MPADEEDIRDVMEEETRRGSRRKPLDSAARAKLRRLRQDLRRALLWGDEKELMRIIGELEWKDESPEIAQILKIFRALRGGEQKS
jgi:hypothetical protein